VVSCTPFFAVPVEQFPPEHVLPVQQGLLQSFAAPAVHVPVWQVFGKQASVLQSVPGAFAGFEQTPAVHVPALWHTSEAVQVTGVPGVHVPVWQVFGKQASVLQSVPGAFAGFEQTPAVHVPAVWHTSEAVQVTGVPAVHVPDLQDLGKQASVVQSVFSAFAGLEQFPVAGSHVPAMWHTSEAEQVFAVPGVQTPAWQMSPVVQELPSLHVVLFATATQVPVAVAHV
jgi:peroxiredoxin